MAGDGINRVALTNWDSKVETIYTFEEGVPTDPLVTPVHDQTPLWFNLGAVDLEVGNSLILIQDDYSNVGAYRLDVDAGDWAPVIPNLEGPLHLYDSTVFDANQDGLRDLVVWGNVDEQTIHVYRSDGAGGIVQQNLGMACKSAEAGYIHAGDMTGDGVTDLVCRGDVGVVHVLVNEGDAFDPNPQVIEVEAGIGFVGVADMLGDGSNDLLLRNAPNSLLVLPEPFGETQPITLPFDVSDASGSFDFDSDGIDEVVVKIAGGTYVIVSERL